MIEQTWTKQVLQHRTSKRSNIGYVMMVLSCCWLSVCLLNVLLLAFGLFNDSALHISLGVAVYTLFSLIFLLPGILVFATITAFRRLFQRSSIVRKEETVPLRRM